MSNEIPEPKVTLTPAGAWITKAGLDCASYVGNEYNGIAKMFCDTIGASADSSITFLIFQAEKMINEKRNG